MTWKLTHFGRKQSGLYGVPWRDLSDEEFSAAEARYPALRERGYFYEVAAATDPENMGTIEPANESQAVAEEAIESHGFPVAGWPDDEPDEDTTDRPNRRRRTK